MTQKELMALLLLAGFGEGHSIHRLENQYWPDAYVERKKNSPWWLVLTEFGPIKMGWRNRAISISWQDTTYRGIITEDDVTKEEMLVHAWSYVKALEYLTELHKRMKICKSEEIIIAGNLESKSE